MTSLTKTAWMALTTVTALLCLTLGGCGGPGRYDVEVTLDGALKGQTVEVDLIGVNNAQKLGIYKAYEVSKYFGAGDNQRADEKSKHTMKFVAGGADKQVLSSGDAKWENWNTPTDLVVMASIPGLADKKGEMDPRRTILPLDTKNWEGRKLEIQVTRSGLNVLTHQKKED